MWKYILKRLVSLIPVVLGVTLLVYLIMYMAPGDPAKSILGEQASPEDIAALREAMGLNDHILIQYGRYITKVFRLDFGESYKTRLPILVEIAARFPNTLKLTVCASIITICFSIPLGIFAAIKQNTIFDGISMIIALIGVSMPTFWMGLMLILFFSLQLGWVPSSGSDGWKTLILPSISLGFTNMASIARTTRSSMLEVIRQDYIRTARSKGISFGRVIKKHAIRNALIPTITVVGLRMGFLLGGSVITESVFAWPGIGRYMIQGIQGRDIPVVLGCIIIFTVCFSIINLLVDLAYAFVDPRIRAQYS